MGVQKSRYDIEVILLKRLNAAKAEYEVALRDSAATLAAAKLAFSDALGQFNGFVIDSKLPEALRAELVHNGRPGHFCG